MRRSFKIPAPFNWRSSLRRWSSNRASLVRAGLGALLALNLAGAWFVIHPPGGSLEDLEVQIVTARQQIVQRQQAISRLQVSIDKTGRGRSSGNAFLTQYFLPRKHAYSLLEVELGEAAKSAGLRAKDRTFNYEPIEGSDTLGMLTINANFEGTYADLIQFINQMDRARRLVIIESLQAQPQQGTPVLSINMKLNAFFRFEGPQEEAQP